MKKIILFISIAFSLLNADEFDLVDSSKQKRVLYPMTKQETRQYIPLVETMATMEKRYRAKKAEQAKMKRIKCWSDISISENSINSWESFGFGCNEVTKNWNERKFTASEAMKWKNNSFTPSEAKEWKDADFSSTKAKKMKDRGFSPN